MIERLIPKAWHFWVHESRLIQTTQEEIHKHSRSKQFQHYYRKGATYSCQQRCFQRFSEQICSLSKPCTQRSPISLERKSCTSPKFLPCSHRFTDTGPSLINEALLKPRWKAFLSVKRTQFEKDVMTKSLISLGHPIDRAEARPEPKPFLEDLKPKQLLYC